MQTKSQPIKVGRGAKGSVTFTAEEDLANNAFEVRFIADVRKMKDNDDAALAALVDRPGVEKVEVVAGALNTLHCYLAAGADEQLFIRNVEQWLPGVLRHRKDRNPWLS